MSEPLSEKERKELLEIADSMRREHRVMGEGRKFDAETRVITVNRRVLGLFLKAFDAALEKK